MKLMKLLVMACLVSMVAWSCGDDTGPELTINSPANGSTYAPGDDISISVVATDDVGVTSISVNGDLITPGSFDAFTDPMNAALDIDITLDASTPVGDYSLTLTAFDGDGNTDEEILEFSVQ